MRWFVTAQDPETGETYAQEVEGDCFEEAAATGRELARDAFGGRRPRLTGVVKCPERNPTESISAFIAGVHFGEQWRKAS